jgi:hypothetical protein
MKLKELWEKKKKQSNLPQKRPYAAVFRSRLSVAAGQLNYGGFDSKPYSPWKRSRNCR